MRRRREGEAEGGCGGKSAAPEPKRSPAVLLVQSRTQQKSFLFLLEEKIWRAQIKKCRENFFAGRRASASGSGAERQFRSKWFRAKFRISHQEKNLGIVLGFSLGGVCWKKSELILNKIPTDCRASLGRTKTEREAFYYWGFPPPPNSCLPAGKSYSLCEMRRQEKFLF